MKYRKMKLRPWSNPADTYLMDVNAMIEEKDPKIQDVYCKSNLYADKNQKNLPILSRSKIVRRFMWKLAFNASVRKFEKR